MGFPNFSANCAPTTVGGQLNAEWVELLMGYPTGLSIGCEAWIE
jgi:hypothetical protein